MNDQNRIYIASKAIDLAETKTYIELTNRLCYYGYPNLNNVMLPIEGAEEKAQTLINMPVVAKFVKDAQGNPDLGGHECHVNPISGEITFGTENIGTHTSVEVKEDTVNINGELVTTPCLFATSRVWTRNKNVVAAIKRLYEEGKLFSSWEILTSSYTFENGMKTLTDYVFESNCLLGTKSKPAFGDAACALDLVASVEPEMMVAQALAEDIGSNESQEETPMLIEEIIAGAEPTVIDDMATDSETAEPVVEEVSVEAEETTVESVEEPVVSNEEETVEETAEEPVVSNEEPVVEEQESVVSTITDMDIFMMLTEQCRKALGQWCYIAFHFPVEKTIWVDYENKERELDYKLFTYEVVDDTVVISDPIDVTLTVSVSEINSAIAERDAALASANETILDKDATISELSQYKERIAEIEREQAEAELATRRNELSEYAIRSGLISANELSEGHANANKTLIDMISKVDEQGIKGVIAERFMTSITNKPTNSNKVVATENARADINNDATVATGGDFVKAYIKKK